MENKSKMSLLCAAFEHWLDTGMTINLERNTDEPCLFAGTGFSESDGIKEVVE